MELDFSMWPSARKIMLVIAYRSLLIRLRTSIKASFQMPEVLTISRHGLLRLGTRCKQIANASRKKRGVSNG